MKIEIKELARTIAALSLEQCEELINELAENHFEASWWDAQRDLLNQAIAKLGSVQ